MHRDDRTVAVTREFGSRVFEHERVGYAHPHLFLLSALRTLRRVSALRRAVARALVDRRWLLLVLAVATATAFFRLGAKGFWGDEIWTLTWPRYQPLLDTFWRFRAPPDLPLNFMVTQLVSTLGTSEFVVRFPEAVLAVATVGLVYAIGQRYLNRPIAVAAALLLACAAYRVWYAQDARPYGPLAFYAVLSLVGVLRLIEKPGLAGAATFVVATVLGVYDHLFGLFPLASEAVFVALWGVAVLVLAPRRPGLQDRRQVVRVGLAFAVSGVVVVLLCWPLAGPIWSYLQVGGGNGAGGTLTFGYFELSFAFLADLFGRFGFGVGWRFIPVALLCLLGIVASFRWRWWLPLLGVVWLVYIPTQPLQSALEQAGFVAVARADWEPPGMHDVTSYAALPFPVTETRANLYRLDPQPRSRVEFHDTKGSAVSSGWPDYVDVTANAPVDVPVAVPRTSAEHVLRVTYLAYPGRDLVVVVGGQELARIGSSQGDGGWHPIDIPLPSGLSGTIMVEFRAGGSIASVSVVEIVDRVP